VRSNSTVWFYFGVIGEPENLYERRKRYKIGVRNGAPPLSHFGGADDLEAERKTNAENLSAQHLIAK